jgi:hypothetical protein
MQQSTPVRFSALVLSLGSHQEEASSSYPNFKKWKMKLLVSLKGKASAMACHE